MRLTIIHPELISEIKSFKGGLLPVRPIKGDNLSLVIKTQKDTILTAKTKNGFSLYLVTIDISIPVTIGIVTAFFDDIDTPMTIRSVMFGDDPFSYQILEILSYKEIDIYFFDEHNYEWMSFRAVIKNDKTIIPDGNSANLLPWHPAVAKSMYSDLINWFSRRTIREDEQSTQVYFKNPLLSRDIHVSDMTAEMNDYQGSSGYRHDKLIRDNPGYFQERDISACLLRCFKPKEIMMSPKRIDNNKEVLDHLIIIDKVALLIQAKDSLTTENGVIRTIERKRLSARKQVASAIRQINDAARYLGVDTNTALCIGEEIISLDLKQHCFIGLAIVKELFEVDKNEYTSAYADFSGLNGGGLIMDYDTFHQLTNRAASANDFLISIMRYVERTKNGGWFDMKEAVYDDALRKKRHQI